MWFLLMEVNSTPRRWMGWLMTLQNSTTKLDVVVDEGGGVGDSCGIVVVSVDEGEYYAEKIDAVVDDTA